MHTRTRGPLIVVGYNTRDSFLLQRGVLSLHTPTHPHTQVLKLGHSERFWRCWEYYFSYCEGGFAAGYIDVVHITLHRPDGYVPVRPPPPPPPPANLT